MSTYQTQAEAMFACKESLVDLLEAELAPVQVSWSHPGGKIEAETVVVGGIRPINQTSANLADRQRDCEFTIDLAANVMKRTSPKETAARAVALAARVETILRENPQLGIPETILFAQTSSVALTETFKDRMREAEVPLTIAIRARLARS